MVEMHGAVVSYHFMLGSGVSERFRVFWLFGDVSGRIAQWGDGDRPDSRWDRMTAHERGLTLPVYQAIALATAGVKAPGHGGITTSTLACDELSRVEACASFLSNLFPTRIPKNRRDGAEQAGMPVSLLIVTQTFLSGVGGGGGIFSPLASAFGRCRRCLFGLAGHGGGPGLGEGRGATFALEEEFGRAR